MGGIFDQEQAPLAAQLTDRVDLRADEARDMNGHHGAGPVGEASLDLLDPNAQ